MRKTDFSNRKTNFVQLHELPRPPTLRDGEWEASLSRDSCLPKDPKCTLVLMTQDGRSIEYAVWGIKNQDTDLENSLDWCTNRSNIADEQQSLRHVLRHLLINVFQAWAYTNLSTKRPSSVSRYRSDVWNDNKDNKVLVHWTSVESSVRMAQSRERRDCSCP